MGNHCAAEIKKLPADAFALAVLARLNGDDPCTFVTSNRNYSMPKGVSYASIWHDDLYDWTSNYELVSISAEGVRWLKFSGSHGC